MHELIHDPDIKVTLHYIGTEIQKGNVFTKAMTPATFRDAVATIGMMGKLEAASDAPR